MSNGPVLILGARSDIARALARKFAALGHPIQLAARCTDALAGDKADLELRHRVKVTLHAFDALATASHAAFTEGLPELPDIAVCAVGYMGEQANSERDVAAAIHVMRTNYEGPASILAQLANRFAERGSGTLVGISSVAGERGRAANYIYGSAKAGLTAYLSGLRNRLAKRNVHVVTVLPGFVATQATQGMRLPALLTARPEEVASAIAEAVARRRNVIYVRPTWRVLMSAIRNIPEGVFKRMNI